MTVVTVGTRVRIADCPPTRAWNREAWDGIKNATGTVEEIRMLPGERAQGFLVRPDPERTEARTITCDRLWWLVADEFTALESKP